MMDSEPTPSQFSMSNFETLVAGIELLYGVGRKLSDAIARQPCEYLIQEASMAFVKTMMSVFGFLRFIPASRFFANAGETVTDLSSASVMGRQVLEDTISFFYLSEPNLTPQEKCLRELVWEFHGKSEHIDSGRLAAVPNVERSPVWAECERLRQAVRKHPLLETHPMIVGPENKRRRDNIRNGREGQILHDHEILKRRGICTERYDLPRKVLSNFAHFSKFSHDLMMQTSADWRKSWSPFLHPTHAVAMFLAELHEAFIETFPQTRQLLSQAEQEIVAKWRAPLKSPY
jgi:hypothetical protein